LRDDLSGVMIGQRAQSIPCAGAPCSPSARPAEVECRSGRTPLARSTCLHRTNLMRYSIIVSFC
jgi:hypothetical protein